MPRYRDDDWLVFDTWHTPRLVAVCHGFSNSYTGLRYLWSNVKWWPAGEGCQHQTPGTCPPKNDHRHGWVVDNHDDSVLAVRLSWGEINVKPWMPLSPTQEEVTK